LKKYENYYLINNLIKITYNQLLILSKIKNIKSNNFIYNNETNLWYYKNYKSTKSLIELFFPDKKILDIKFKDNNYNDYINIKLILNLKYSNSFIDPDNCEIILRGEPYLITEGKCAGEYRNMYWKIKDSENNIYYIMHIKNNIITKISCDDINKVLIFYDKRRTWKLQQNGYISTTITINEKQKVYYLHQLIMDVHNEDLTSFEKTVDHINRDKLDNRKENLRLVNMSVQNSNRDKQKRHHNACLLPEELELDNLPKYVCYRKEKLDEDKYREYFYICNHPKLERWETTKSNKVSLKQKLELVIEKINELNEPDIINIPDDNELDLPQYIKLITFNDKYHLVFDWRSDIRYSLKMILKSCDIQTELNIFIDKINDKYSNLNMKKYIIKNKKFKINNNDISETIIEENKIKLTLPPNFTFYKEKESYYLQYSKIINREKISKKIKLINNNIQENFNNLILILENKYSNIEFPKDYIIPEKINIIPEKNNINSENTENNSEIYQNKLKPIMPTHFSICSINNIEYIQFCKKIDNKRLQYKTKINSYDIQEELNKFVLYINQNYLDIGSIDNYKIVNTNNWQTINKIVIHEDTDLKIKNREIALKCIEKKKLELGEEEYKKQKNEYMKTYRNT
jgi:hypothetical protein